MFPEPTSMTYPKDFFCSVSEGALTPALPGPGAIEPNATTKSALPEIDDRPLGSGSYRRGGDRNRAKGRAQRRRRRRRLRPRAPPNDIDDHDSGADQAGPGPAVGPSTATGPDISSPPDSKHLQRTPE